VCLFSLPLAIIGEPNVIRNVQKLHFPQPALRIELRDGVACVWDIARKRWVKLTPEEWVRQHLLHFLVDYLGCPLSLLAVEKTVVYNGMRKRSDLVVFGNALQPLLLAECKSADVPLNQAVFEQAAMYNSKLKVPFLLATNGLKTYCCEIDFKTGSYRYLQDIPDFAQMKAIVE
jgi:hypothetical protein